MKIETTFLALTLILSLMLSGTVSAFKMEGFKSEIQFDRSSGVNPEEFGVWLVYTTTEYGFGNFWEVRDKWSSDIRTIPLIISASGEFTVPELDFGDGQFYRFYKGNPYSGIVSASYDRYNEENKRALICLVPKQKLNLENSEVAERLIWNSRNAAENLGVISRISVQLDGCGESKNCGGEYLKSIFESLSLTKLHIQSTDNSPDLDELFTLLEPRSSMIELEFRSDAIGTAIETSMIFNENNDFELSEEDTIELVVLTGREDVYMKGEFSVLISNEKLEKCDKEIPGLSDYWDQVAYNENSGGYEGISIKREDYKRWVLNITPLTSPIHAGAADIPLALNISE